MGKISDSYLLDFQRKFTPGLQHLLCANAYEKLNAYTNVEVKLRHKYLSLETIFIFLSRKLRYNKFAFIGHYSFTISH